ncbi:MAG: P1 family peptidase [Alphaproteobacteria bacterium]|nr:P1 family peptidase [Alphaproteobacteria bacterium]MCW5741815.1 P1 family peptidase [Alphaproteobacteria bacterium]
MIRPGPSNLITDVDGILVGNAEDAAVRSGTTVVLAEQACAASVDVRGGAPGTRDTDLLDPTCRVQAIDAVFLSGGSAFGLSAGDGVMKWLRERGRGTPVGGTSVPITPGAILFDLLNGGSKDWDWPPYRELGYRAADGAAKTFVLGNAGAGLGARCGHLKGGLGSASAVDPASGLQVGAIVAVNAVGFATMGELPHFWAWALEQDGEFGGLPPPPRGLNLAVSHTRQLLDHDAALAAQPLANTTIAVVATNARLDKAWCQRLAIMAQDGLARALRPVHTPADGDAVFAMATGRVTVADDPIARAEIGTLAADCLARAVARGVYSAGTLGGMPGWKDTYGR